MRNAILTGLLLSAPAASAQLIVDSAQTPESFILDQLGGTGVVCSNVTWSGDTNQFAGFDGTACNIGLAHGLIVATGDASMATGPNDQGYASLGGGHPGVMDQDLSILSTQMLNDAASLEFDVVPTGDSLRITFVFASEEYLEFVNSINDVMGVFLSGPGISGPFSNSGVNIATVPVNGWNYPVSVNSINNENNADLYIDNGDGQTAPFNSDSTVVQYDGFTVPLTFAWPVQSGMTYHVRVAIADASDTAWDSAVFLAAGSLTTQSLIVSGMDGPAATTPLSVHPDPVTGPLVISGLSTTGLSQVVLLDGHGAVVRERWANGPSTSMDLSGLSPGTYLLHVTDARGVMGIQRVMVTQVAR